ncbi:MAG TPA: hypothetical protein VGG56_06400 [Terracidiphilus sp.]
MDRFRWARKEIGVAQGDGLWLDAKPVLRGPSVFDPYSICRPTLVHGTVTGVIPSDSCGRKQLRVEI